VGMRGAAQGRATGRVAEMGFVLGSRGLCGSSKPRRRRRAGVDSGGEEVSLRCLSFLEPGPIVERDGGNYLSVRLANPAGPHGRDHDRWGGIGKATYGALPNCVRSILLCSADDPN
jgi:hypothetical protein